MRACAQQLEGLFPCSDARRVFCCRPYFSHRLGGGHRIGRSSSVGGYFAGGPVAAAAEAGDQARNPACCRLGKPSNPPGLKGSLMVILSSLCPMVFYRSSNCLCPKALLLHPQKHQQEVCRTMVHYVIWYNRSFMSSRGSETHVSILLKPMRGRCRCFVFVRSASTCTEAPS